MEKEKKFMIIGVFILLISLVGAAGTYAWFTWSSTNNTNLTMSIGASSDVIFKNGNDISTNKLAPVFNYTDGEKTSFTITNKSTTSFSYRISLNITSIDNELKNKSLKYKLVSNNTIITEGDFSNIESNSKNTLYEGELSKGNISYIFYLYIDGNEENDLNMINKSLVGTITVAEATATYQLTNEDGTSYTPSYSGSGTKVVRSNAALSKFKEVRVDNVTIDSSNYTLTEGSTIVTFKDSYLKTLSEGEHTLKIISNDGFALGKITVEKPTLAKKITSLYTNATKTTTTVNSVTYNLASSVGLMNDRKGSMSTNIDASNIRYYGTSPNNYIYFNCSDYSNQTSSTCETWRIIGVFDDKVKIMRGSQIGNYSWDSSASDVDSGRGVNEWSQADLMKLLNSGYDSEIFGGSLYWNAKSGECYSGSDNMTKTCDFTNTGFKNDTTRNMIAETTYYTRGHNTAVIYVNEMYNKERVSGTVVSATPTRTLTWTGKVAVAYPSDYGYAADLSLCQKQLGSYNDVTCTANNWMKSILASNYGWLLTPESGYENAAWRVSSSGSVYYSGIAYLAYGVLPVLSLISELDIGSGSGTSSSPYQLSV